MVVVMVVPPQLDLLRLLRAGAKPNRNNPPPSKSRLRQSTNADPPPPLLSSWPGAPLMPWRPTSRPNWTAGRSILQHTLDRGTSNYRDFIVGIRLLLRGHKGDVVAGDKAADGTKTTSHRNSREQSSA
jgi:hypothetical protein